MLKAGMRSEAVRICHCPGGCHSASRNASDWGV